MNNNQLFLKNIEQVINLKYHHLLLPTYDLYNTISDPKIRKIFYPFFDNNNWNKVGFFNNGQTLLWGDYSSLDKGTIKISNDIHGKTLDQITWSEAFSLGEPDSPMHIYKMMKLQAFW